jgi:hypothetical protein
MAGPKDATEALLPRTNSVPSPHRTHTTSLSSLVMTYSVHLMTTGSKVITISQFRVVIGTSGFSGLIESWPCDRADVQLQVSSFQPVARSRPNVFSY